MVFVGHMLGSCHMLSVFKYWIDHDRDPSMITDQVQKANLYTESLEIVKLSVKCFHLYF